MADKSTQVLELRREPYPGARIAFLGLLAVLILVPVTLPVTVLRALISERFDVSELLTSLFMSINMVGAFVAAPIAGALADRLGRRVEIIVGALLCDGVLLYALTLDVPFALFMSLRFLEGGAHIVALSLLLAIASNARAPERRGRVMGLTGGGIMLGVALGAPLGGVLGREDPLAPPLLGRRHRGGRGPAGVARARGDRQGARCTPLPAPHPRRPAQRAPDRGSPGLRRSRTASPWASTPRPSRSSSLASTASHRCRSACT